MIIIPIIVLLGITGRMVVKLCETPVEKAEIIIEDSVKVIKDIEKLEEDIEKWFVGDAQVQEYVKLALDKE